MTTTSKRHEVWVGRGCGIVVVLVGLFILLGVIPGWLPPYPRPWIIELITTTGLAAVALGVIMIVTADDDE